MKWIFKPEPNDDQVSQLAQSLNIDQTLAKVLVQRGVTNFEEAKEFFRPSLSDLHDPFLMKDMDLAVDRILKAIENQENILVYGDYDVDGTTSVSLMLSYLKNITPQVASYIPDRYEEGYGISIQGIDFAADNDISLIIALDCGIKAIDKVAYAQEKNIDFIICDHHRPGDSLPNAVAVLDPKREDCDYPYDELCGCGVGFKLIQALAKTRNETIESLVPYLDLVATAIGADIVPITGENRVLAKFGLEVINHSPRQGIRAITSQIKKTSLTISDVVFIIAPRINAAGRMKHGLHAVTLLTENDFELAQRYASEIEEFNTNRKLLDQQIEKEALEQIVRNNEEHHFSSVVFQENWHKGVIGIAASRLIESYYRPTLVFTKSNNFLAASARSVRGFDVYNALYECREFIEQFGGHKYAAGLTILPENYENFKQKFEEVVKESIPPELLKPQLLIDAEVELNEITPKFCRILKQFEPFGPQNMKPVFKSTGLKDNGYGKKVGETDDHLKTNIIQGTDPRTYNAIGFGLGEKLDLIQKGNLFSAAYTIEENVWNGMSSLQLNLKDIIPEE